MALHLNMHTITEFDKLLNIRLSINTKAFNTKKYIFTPIKKKKKGILFYKVKTKKTLQEMLFTSILITSSLPQAGIWK